MAAPIHIALGTDDGITLKHGRFGDSASFKIITIENERIVTSSTRNNIHSDPTIENKPPKILSLLNDCTAFVGRSWRAGSFSFFTENGKMIFLCDIDKLDEIFSALINKNFSRLKVFDLNARKFVQADRI